MGASENRASGRPDPVALNQALAVPQVRWTRWGPFFVEFSVNPGGFSVDHLSSRKVQALGQSQRALGGLPRDLPHQTGYQVTRKTGSERLQ